MCLVLLVPSRALAVADDRVPNDGFQPRLYLLVPAGAERARVVVGWQAATERAPRMRLITPGGRLIEAALFVPAEEAARGSDADQVVERRDLADARRRVWELHRPTPGRWVIECLEARPELGWISLEELETPPLPPPPRVEWAKNYRSITSTGRVEIAGRLHHAPADAELVLNAGGEAREGAALPGVRREGDRFSCVVDTGPWEPGAYFIRGVLRDRRGASLASTLFPVVVKVKGQPRLEFVMLDPVPAQVEAGGLVELRAVLRNVGRETAAAPQVGVTAPGDVRVSIIEPDAAGRRDDLRVAMAPELRPGASVFVRVAVHAPDQPGRLAVDLRVPEARDRFAGALVGHWSGELAVVPRGAAAAAAVDLRVERSAPRGELMVGASVRYTVTVQNRGQLPATTVRLRERLSQGRLRDGRTEGGSVRLDLADDGAAEVVWQRVEPGAAVSVEFEARLEAAALFSVTSSAAATEADANPYDNVVARPEGFVAPGRAE